MNPRLNTAGALVLPVTLSFLSAFASAQTDNAKAPTNTKTPLPLISGPRTAFSATVHEGHSLGGDRFGSYQDGLRGSGVYHRDALNIFAWRFVDGRSNTPDSTTNAPRERYMTIDLSRPVEASGAVKLPRTTDYLARFHAFWNYEDPKPGTSASTMRFVTNIPIGETVESERIEIWVLVSGVQHVLQMGPWAMGKFSARASIDGRGTTKATITRQADDSWRIKASDDSIARLWDYSNIQHPVDKGLYFFGFDVEFNRLR